MADTSRSIFARKMALCLLAAIVLYVIAFVYFRTIAGESNPGITGSKILALVCLFLASNAAQISIAISLRQFRAMSLFLTNLAICLFFFTLLFVGAASLHPGLAKDAMTSTFDGAEFFLVQFAILGLPVVLLNTLLGISIVRFIVSSHLKNASR